MAALEHSFADPPPTELYLDTDFLISYLIDSEPHHARCRTFMQRLERGGQTNLYLSSLSWMELANVVMKESFRARLSADFQRRFSFDRWQEWPIRDAYLTYVLNALETALAQFEWHEIPLTSDVRLLASGYIARYNLGAHDAAHLASARYVGVRDLASLDEAFRRVDDIVLWNDHIHERR